jgi:hypothetical protein
LSDPLSSFKKKKKTELPKPEKISTHFAKSEPSSPPLKKPHKPQPQRVQAQKIQALKVKPVVRQQYHAKPKHQQRTQPQASVYNPEDFQFHTAVDNIGINILVKFQGTHIYTFLLPSNDYELFQRMFNSQKYEYVKAKVSPSAFLNEGKLIYAVIKTIINVLDTLFARALELQAQAQQNQQQRTQAQNGGFNRW